MGCVERQFDRAPIITMYVGQLTMQLVLLFLFVLPMKKHASLAPEDARNVRKQLNMLVKRSIYITCLCVANDTISFILSICLLPITPFIVLNFIYDFNLMLNTIFVIGSFADWKQRLSPYHVLQRDRELMDKAHVRVLNPATSSEAPLSSEV